MRFIDEAKIRVQSGTGGNGSASFRREKHVPFGGPNGANGGRGGNVVLVATSSLNTLLVLRGHALWRAEGGSNGKSQLRTGADADDVVIKVPVGTRIFDDDNGDILADLTEDGIRWIAAKGGNGGLGNINFKSSTNRAPRKFTPGWPGEERTLRLELMLMADVGLLGFPNAGKSTFISRVSAARPRVADYPFTTLVPNLGVVSMGDEGSFVIADIPGLIRGASEGAGLGHQFLRHVQRTRLLLHLVSLGSDEAESPAERYAAIREELVKYDPELSERQEVILLTKADLCSDTEAAEAAATIQALAPERALFIASAVSGRGLRPVTGRLWTIIQQLKQPPPEARL